MQLMISWKHVVLVTW